MIQENLGPFKGECYVAAQTFISAELHSRKQPAKEDVAKVTYEGLWKNPEIQRCFKTRTAYRIDPALLHEQFKAHFSVSMSATQLDMGNQVPRHDPRLVNPSPELTSFAPSYPMPPRDPYQPPLPLPPPPQRGMLKMAEPRDPRLFQVPPPPPGSSYSMHYPNEPESFAAGPPPLGENYYPLPAPIIIKDEQPDLVVVFDRPGRSEDITQKMIGPCAGTALPLVQDPHPLLPQEIMIHRLALFRTVIDVPEEVRPREITMATEIDATLLRLYGMIEITVSLCQV
jgi:hypothetical protein